MKKPELLAPGGSFAAAFQAFEAGADGVYLGLGDFSARKSAVNFSMEQLRRIRELARQRDRRIYVTLNTIIREDEMPRVASLCAWLEALEVDGVIVQDIGLLSLLARSFPRLAIHASTQMAVHNDGGLRFAQEAGIRRVVLSRELTLEQITALRIRHPGIELEVFIHGALCYSFSGVCLASWALTGRSGNRGECAQICRSVFCGEENGEQSRDANPFSCRDLALGSDVLKLAEIGIDSLKIEGRMKPPEYVFHVTRMYREILDKGGALPREELEQLRANAEATFSREKTKGYFSSPRGHDLITTGYPGHRGIPLGAVAEIRGRQMRLRLASRLSLHDGIGFWPAHAGEPVIFAVKAILKGTRPARFAEAGETVLIPLGEDASAPAVGTEIRLFSSRFLDRPVPKETGFAPFKIPISLEATAGQEGISCSVSSRLGRFTFSAPLTLLDSTGKKSFREILRKVLGESSGSLASVKDFSFVNATNRPDDGIFVPPSELKKLRNNLHAALESWLLEAIEEKGRAALSALPALAPRPWPLSEPSVFSDRYQLSPPGGAHPTPFATLDDVRQGPPALSSCEGFVSVPLPPVMIEEEEWAGSLQRLCAEHPHERFALGLNNVGHLALAKRLAGSPNCYFFVDYFLYVANRSALSFLGERLDRLLFLSSWIEGGGDLWGTGEMPPMVVRIAKDYRPALFYSLGCYQRHAVAGGRCQDGCPKDFAYELTQGRNRFDVVVKDCVTYLIRKEKEKNHAGKLRAHSQSNR